MALTASTVRATAADYREHEPLYPVEQEQLETLPAALESGTYGWRDLEWIVRWYYRRSLGDVAHTERRAAEAAFRRNDFESVQAALEAVIATEPANVGARLERLTALKGVDVPVASAFLFVLEPERYIVVGERECRHSSRLASWPVTIPIHRHRPTTSAISRAVEISVSASSVRCGRCTAHSGDCVEHNGTGRGGGVPPDERHERYGLLSSISGQRQVRRSPGIRYSSP